MATTHLLKVWKHNRVVFVSFMDVNATRDMFGSSVTLEFIPNTAEARHYLLSSGTWVTA